MFTIEFYNNEISRTEKIEFKTFKEALQEYLKILDIPWWEADISDLKIFKNGKDITKKVNKILEE
jgi:hypothetical protein